jgi:hypothetical protein
LAHGCTSTTKVVHPKVTLFDGAAPLETRPARAAVDSLLFDPNPGATNPASFVRADWPCTTRVVAEGTWHVTTHDRQGAYGRDHYSRVFRSERRGP